MNENYFNILFNYDGIQYDGFVTPSEKLHDDGMPSSFHVVLNNVLFGNVHFNNGKWAVDEQRPQALTDIVGECIERYYLNRA